MKDRPLTNAQRLHHGLTALLDIFPRLVNDSGRKVFGQVDDKVKGGVRLIAIELHKKKDHSDHVGWMVQDTRPSARKKCRACGQFTRERTYYNFTEPLAKIESLEQLEFCLQRLYSKALKKYRALTKEKG